MAIFIKKKLPLEIYCSKLDKEGRYTILIGKLNGSSITIASICGPNVTQDIYLLQFLDTLGGMARGEIILTGDFNAVWNPD